MSDIDKSSTTFLGSIGIYFLIFICLSLLFCYIRGTDKSIYRPKTFIGEKHKLVKKPPSGLFAWISALYHISEEEIIKHNGIEAFMLIYFLKSSLYLFFVFTVYGLGVLLPLNVVGQNKTQIKFDDTNSTRSFKPEMFAISNIEKDSENRCYAHLFGAYLLTALFIRFVVNSYKLFVRLKQEEFATSEYQNDVFRKAVLIRNIPNCDKSQMVSWFNQFSDGANRIVFNKDVKNLNKYINQRNKIHSKLEEIITKYMISLSKKNLSSTSEKGSSLRPRHRIGFLSMFGEKVDSITYYLKELEKCEEIIEIKKETKASLCDSMVVVFNSVIGAHLACQSRICENMKKASEKSLNLHPKDIVWGNANLTQKEIRVRSIIVNLLSACIIIFWSVPVSFVTTLSSLDQLSKKIPFLGDYKWLGKGTKEFIEKTLPTMTLAILVGLVPVIFKILSKYQGLLRETQVKNAVMTKYFWFLIVTVLFYVTIFKSFTDTILYFKKLGSNSGDIVDLFSNNIPGSSTFFMIYFLLKALLDSPKIILQPINYLKRRILFVVFSYSPRKRLDSFSIPNIEYEFIWPEQAVSFIIGIIHCIISPLFTPFVTIYFLVYYFVYKYQIIYVYRTDGYFGKSFFTTAINYLFYGFYIFQITFAGIMLPKSPVFYISSILLVPVTVYAHYRISKEYRIAVKYMPVEYINIDRSKKIYQEGNETNYPTSEEIEKLFSNPALADSAPILWIPKDDNGIYEELYEELCGKNTGHQTSIEKGVFKAREVSNHDSYVECKKRVELKLFTYPEEHIINSEIMF